MYTLPGDTGGFIPACISCFSHYSPSQVYLIRQQVITFSMYLSRFWHHVIHNQVTLQFHVFEGRGDEHSDLANTEM